MALHINIYGSPGSGKSTLRSKLFSELKMRGYRVEEVIEYAKELTYANDFSKLSDQVLMLGKQHHPHFVLDDKVDIVVTDSPFIMGITYMNPDEDSYQELKRLSLKLNNSFNTLNVLIERNHPYQTFGRNQTEEESEFKHIEIKSLLDSNGINYIQMDNNENIVHDIIDMIEMDS